MKRKIKKEFKIIGVILVLILILGGIFYYKNSKDKKGDTSLDISEQLDLSAFQKALDDTLKNDNYDELPLFLSSFKQASSCEVITVSPSEDSETFSALVNVKYADVASDLVNYLEDKKSTTFDEDKLNKDIAELVANADQATSECEIYFIKNEDSYSPVFTEEIIDKMYGGIYSAYYNKLDELAIELKGRDQE